MGFVNSLFDSNNSVSAAFYARTDTITSGVRSVSWALAMTKNVILWTDSSIDRMVSERDRADIKAVLIIDPEDYTTAMSDKDKVVIEGISYSIINAQNVAFQDKVVMIPLKAFK